MPSLFDCLNTAITAGMANPARARAAQTEFSEMVARYERAYPTSVAQAMAAADLKAAAQRGATQRRHTVLAQMQTARRNTALINGAGDPGFALIELIEGKEGHSDFENVRFTQSAIARQAMAELGDLTAAHGLNLAGNVRNRAGLDNIVREMHGQGTGDAAAKGMADAWARVTDRLRNLFNAHGGAIGELTDWGMPHSHETGKVRAAGFEAWRAEIEPRLAWDRMTDASTGKPFAVKGGSPDPAAARRMLKNIYDGIASDGMDDLTPSMQTGGKALMNTRADHRELHFRDGDSWIAYNDRFGALDPFRTMMAHAEGMARDIALMRVLGPNPKAGLEHAVQTAKKRIDVEFTNARDAAGTNADALRDVAVRQKKATEKLYNQTARARTMLGSVMGESSVPVNAAWGRFLAGTRQILTGAQLGGAILSAPTDLWTMRMAGRAVGMNGRNMWKRHVELMASKATRQTAAQMGYVADTLSDSGSAAARYLGDVWSPEITSRISNAVLRASGLSYWTDMARTAFQMEFSGHLANNAHLEFGAIDADLRKVLTARGITSGDWDKIRAAPLFTAPGGAKFLTPQYFRNITALDRAEAEGLSIRLQAVIEEQMEIAVPSVTLEGRTMFLGDAKPGSFGGELLRSGMMYKSFALSVTLNQIRRANALPSGMARAQYAAAMIAGMWMLGAVSVQLKELAKGRDPRPMDDWKYWAAAFMQGGGVGIFGDFLTAETSRAGGGMAQTLTGPVVGLGADVLRSGAANVASAVNGRPTHLGRDVTNLARRYTPGTSLWQVRTVLDRLVWDQMQWLLDPDAEAAWARQESNRNKSNGNESWWERGAVAPSRAPNLAAAGGSQ